MKNELTPGRVTLLFLLVSAILVITTPFTDEVLYWAILPVLVVAIFAFTALFLIKKLKNFKIRSRPTIQIIIERSKQDVNKDLAEIRAEIFTLKNMNKTKLLPEKYYKENEKNYR